MKTLLIIALSTFFFNGTPEVVEAPAPKRCVLVIHGIATMPDGSQAPMTLTGRGRTCKKAREGMQESIKAFQLKHIR